MMPYWLRIALGALLGLLAAAALWLLVGVAWLTATLAALLAAIGFLGSYFVWSADRPEIGYEQVLFDRPNTIVAGALVVVFALAGVGSGYLGTTAGPAELTPAERVSFLYADYQRAADAYTSDESDAETTNATIADLRVESDRIAQELEALPASEEREQLVAANDALALAMDAMQGCVGGDSAQCMDARFFAADAKTAIDKAVPAPPEAHETASEA